MTDQFSLVFGVGVTGINNNNSGKLDLIMTSLQVQMLLSYDVHKCNFS